MHSVRLRLGLAAFAILLLCPSLVALARSDRVFLETDAEPRIPEGWRQLGRTEPSQELQLIVGLRQRNIDVLQRTLEEVSRPASASYGAYLSGEEVARLISPSPISERLVREWAHSVGVNIGDSFGGADDWLELLPTAEQAEEMLQVEFYDFEHQSGLVISRALEVYSVPSAVATHIDLIAGVFRFPAFKKHSPSASYASASGVPTSPESIQQQYGITIPPDNSANLQAVASFLGQYYSPSDLSKFETNYGLPQVPISQTYGYNNADKPGTEASLDVQYLLGVTNCSIETWVISTNGTRDYGNEPFLQFLITLPSLPKIPYLISMSYQDLEYTVTESYAIRCSNEFMKYSSQGITFITGSGDWGVGCTDDDHCNEFTSDFPSSSPYVVSTGSTTRTSASSSEEIGVSFSSGGFSNYFAQPSYQAGAVSAFLNQTDKPPTSYYNTSGRAFPDISTIGTNFGVYVHGFLMPVAGTSASTPTFGAILSMLNSLRLADGLPTLGWVQPFLYEAGQSGAFTDVTASDTQESGCCPYSFDTVPGWDPYTGMGVPNYPTLAQLAMSSNIFPSFE